MRHLPSPAPLRRSNPEREKPGSRWSPPPSERRQSPPRPMPSRIVTTTPVSPNGRSEFVRHRESQPWPAASSSVPPGGRRAPRPGVSGNAAVRSATSAPVLPRLLARCWPGTSSTTGTTGSSTRVAGCGPSTWCTTPASITTCPPRCVSPLLTCSACSFPMASWRFSGSALR